MDTVTAMSSSRQGAPETAGDGEPETDGEVVGERVGSGDGLALADVGADEPPGEMSHQTSASTTKTPRITTMRRRQ
jgi:hypothetical protein